MIGFGEGNVQAVLVEHLRTEGWTIRQAADTALRARGIDILAAMDGRTLAVEVKGIHQPPTRAASSWECRRRRIRRAKRPSGSHRRHSASRSQPRLQVVAGDP